MVTEKLDAATRRLMANSLHYPIIVLRRDLSSLLGAHIKDEDRRHAEQARNARQIAEVRRAIRLLTPYDGFPDPQPKESADVHES